MHGRIELQAGNKILVQLLNIGRNDRRKPTPTLSLCSLVAPSSSAAIWLLWNVVACPGISANCPFPRRPCRPFCPTWTFSCFEPSRAMAWTTTLLRATSPSSTPFATLSIFPCATTLHLADQLLQKENTWLRWNSDGDSFSVKWFQKVFSFEEFFFRSI